MKKCNTIPLLALMLFVVSCGRETGQTAEVIDFTNAKQIDFGEFISSRSYIVLDNRPEAFISRINKVIKANDAIYVLDRNFKADKLVKFSLDGQYECCVSRQGRGPNEYLTISDFEIFNDTIFVLDFNKDEILKFINDTILHSRVTIAGIGARNFELTANGCIFYSPNYGDQGSPNAITVADKEGHCVSRSGYYGDTPESIEHSDGFKKNSDIIVHHRAVSDSIFIFDSASGDIIGAYRSDFGSANVDARNLEVDELFPPHKIYSWLVNVPIITNDLIIGFANILSEGRAYVYSKSRKQVYFDSSNSIQIASEVMGLFDQNTIVCCLDQGMYEGRIKKESPEFEVPRHIVDSLNAGHYVLTLYGLKSQNTDDR